jgi:hypothetical protein
MPNSNQNDPDDEVARIAEANAKAEIARITEANAKAYGHFASASKIALQSELDSKSRLSDEWIPAVPRRQTWRARPLRVAFIGLLVVTFFGVAGIALKYRQAAELILARWTKPSWIMQAAPQARITPPSTPSISFQMAQSLQNDLARVVREIEQLKANQEQLIKTDTAIAALLKASQEQMVGENARVVDQLTAALAQMTRSKLRRRIIATAPPTLATGTMQDSLVPGRSGPP